MAKPNTVLTPKQIEEAEKLAGLGNNLDALACWFDVSPRTLDAIMSRQPEVKRAIERGRVKANSAVASALFNNAVNKNNVAAQIFWCKTRMRWSEARPEDAEGAERPRESVSLNYAVGDDAAGNGKDTGNGKAESEADDDEEPAERQPTH